MTTQAVLGEQSDSVSGATCDERSEKMDDSPSLLGAEGGAPAPLIEQPNGVDSPGNGGGGGTV